GSAAQRGHLERIFGEIEQRWGHLDFFINNASNGLIAPLEQVQEEHWERSFGTNVIGLHRGAMLARPLMAKRGGGRILCISTPGAQRVVHHFGCQGPVKAAMESLVRYLAVELGPDNIQVNCISSGPLYGELLGLYPDAERLVPYWESLSTDGRLGTNEQLAELVCFALSPSATRLNGAVITTDNTGTIRV
ncbi:MAG: SDR family oxidoreductase, partial [Alphaproteobacteria bacterium]|nr:SDR family oxidoreductase [Alphaproteobacteria bacterium]